MSYIISKINNSISLFIGYFLTDFFVLRTQRQLITNHKLVELTCVTLQANKPQWIVLSEAPSCYINQLW